MGEINESSYILPLGFTAEDDEAQIELKPCSSFPLQPSYLLQGSSGTFQVLLIPLYLLPIFLLTREPLVSFCFSQISPVCRCGGFVPAAVSAPKTIFHFFFFFPRRQDLLKERDDKNLT